MRNSTIRYVMALAVFSIVGIIVTQVYWVRRAFDIEEEQFNQSIHIALQSVAERISLLNHSLVNPNPIKQLTSNYYVVNVNDVIDAGILEVFLEEEFSKIHLHIDYEYGIYDCSSNEMVYGSYISRNKNPAMVNYEVNLPKYEEYIYYFGVRFPTKTTYLASQMDIWIFSSFILLIVIIFFAYTLFVIFKQKRLSEVQRDFINNMTHEFKTPISTIAVSSDLLTNPKILDKPESLLKYANIIKSQNNRLKNQIEKVLQMAIMDQGKLKLNKETLDLHDLIRETVQNFNLKTHPDLTLECQLDSPDSLIYADKVHLTNIIYNLLDNAIKYVDGPPKILIKTQAYKNQIILSIQDNGIGISKEHQKKIFDKFFRVPTGNVHNVKGFGLGLNYVKLIVRMHKWTVRLDSELGMGSTFHIYMPLKMKDSKTPSSKKIQASSDIKGEITEKISL
ncbi:MAG: HAMP domain-containing sensor histidine kinase [Microscillaceae bacterium]|nr:HAMP domain-containing sensor histidine kinase [Microscillaceae bacterium]